MPRAETRKIANREPPGHLIEGVTVPRKSTRSEDWGIRSLRHCACETVGLLFGLLIASPKIARAFRDFMVGIVAWASVFVGEVNLEAFQNWLWGTPQGQAQVMQGQPPLSQEADALFVEFQEHMDKQYQMNILARYVLTLPSLPEEGY